MFNYACLLFICTALHVVVVVVVAVGADKVWKDDNSSEAYWLNIS